MARLILRQSLPRIGVQASAGVLALPGDSHSAPARLLKTMRSIRPPMIEGWRPVFRSTFANLEWTDRNVRA